MKQNPELTKIQIGMQPGKFTAQGFLGNDARNLADILALDDTLVKGIGLDHIKIAERLEYFSETGQAGFGSPVVVDDYFEVVVEDHRGGIPCPFRDNHMVEKRNTTLKNLKLNKTIRWSELNIHMIKKHGFYEGKGSFFRVEPALAVEILELGTEQYEGT